MTFRSTLAALVLSAALLAPTSVQATTITGVVPAPQAGTVETLHYSPGVMQRVIRAHMNPARARTGDYVPTMRVRPEATCYTAVNWRSRWMVAHNVILVVDLWNPVKGEWERELCQATDWQQQRHSTGSRQRLEVDGYTAIRHQFRANGTTRARIIGYR